MKSYTDRGLESFNLYHKLESESLRQIKKWGVQSRTLFEWLAYTTEELGELAEAISELEYRKGKAEKVTAEAIQVATLCLKIAEMVEFETDKKKKENKKWPTSISQIFTKNKKS